MSSASVSGGLSFQPTVEPCDPSVSENVPPFQRSGFQRRQRTASVPRSSPIGTPIPCGVVARQQHVGRRLGPARPVEGDDGQVDVRAGGDGGAPATGHHGEPGQAPSTGPKSMTCSKCWARTASQQGRLQVLGAPLEPVKGTGRTGQRHGRHDEAERDALRRLRRRVASRIRCPPSPGRPPAIRFIVLGRARFQGDHTGLKRAMREGTGRNRTNRQRVACRRGGGRSRGWRPPPRGPSPWWKRDCVVTVKKSDERQPATT